GGRHRPPCPRPRRLPVRHGGDLRTRSLRADYLRRDTRQAQRGLSRHQADSHRSPVHDGLARALQPAQASRRQCRPLPAPLAESIFSAAAADSTAEGGARRAPLSDALGEIAGAHGATAAQVSLAWLVRKPNVVAIPGASSVRQLEENVAAADLTLSDDEVRRLDSLSL